MAQRAPQPPLGLCSAAGKRREGLPRRAESGQVDSSAMAATRAAPARLSAGWRRAKMELARPPLLGRGADWVARVSRLVEAPKRGVDPRGPRLTPGRTRARRSTRSPASQRRPPAKQATTARSHWSAASPRALRVGAGPSACPKSPRTRRGSPAYRCCSLAAAAWRGARSTERVPAVESTPPGEGARRRQGVRRPHESQRRLLVALPASAPRRVAARRVAPRLASLLTAPPVRWRSLRRVDSLGTARFRLAGGSAGTRRAPGGACSVIWATSALEALRLP